MSLPLFNLPALPPLFAPPLPPPAAGGRETPAPKAPEPQEPTPRRQEEPLPQLAPGVVACGCGRAARWSYLPSRAACPDHGGQAVCLDPEHKPRDLCLECWCAIPAADRRMGWYLEYYPRPGEMEALETARERRRAVLELVELDEERAL